MLQDCYLSLSSISILSLFLSTLLINETEAISRQRTTMTSQTKRESLFLSRTIFRGVCNIILRQRICMYRNRRNYWRIDWAVLIPFLRSGLPLHRETFQLIQYIPSIQHSSKYSVNIVEMRLSFICYEEL